MNERWVKYKEWWVGLESREKTAVMVGSILLGLFIIYEAIWAPFTNHIEDMRHQLSTAQKTLMHMQATDQAIQALNGKPPSKQASTSLIVLLSQIQKQIIHAKLDQYLTQLKQATKDSIEIHFQKIEFDALSKWIAVLIKEDGVSIARMSLIATDVSGYVNADIVVKRRA